MKISKWISKGSPINTPFIIERHFDRCELNGDLSWMIDLILRALNYYCDGKYKILPITDYNPDFLHPFNFNDQPFLISLVNQNTISILAKVIKE